MHDNGKEKFYSYGFSRAVETWSITGELDELYELCDEMYMNNYNIQYEEQELGYPEPSIIKGERENKNAPKRMVWKIQGTWCP